jgi:uncharacterized protein (TIGR00369 family)
VEHLGIEETAPRPGEVRCSLDVTSAHENIAGVVHGSVTFALLDTAMGHALTGTLAPPEWCGTTQISVQYLKAVRAGDRLVALGRVVRRGRRIAYLEGTCANRAGEEVARAQGTWYVGRRDE